MALNLTAREANLQAMRGNAERQVAPKPVETPAPAPVAQAPTIDMQPVADAISQSNTLMAHVVAKIADIQPQVVLPEAKAPSKWTFKITERDRMGNIVAFTAEAK